MALYKLAAGFVLVASVAASVVAQSDPQEDLILCDCGIGDNKAHPSWSTSRQMNYYKSLTWPPTVETYPRAPDMAVQIPYGDGTYPWVPSGATAKMSNGDVWTAYIQDSTPDGFKAGTAVSSKNGGDKLNCWAYRGRPVSAAINTTVNHDAICWTAFVCNHNSRPPPPASGMGSKTSTLTTASAAPETSFISATPPAGETRTGSQGGGHPMPTANPKTGKLLIAASVNPRFVTWQGSWIDFIKDFIWDQNTGKCLDIPISGNGYNISVDCAGIRVDQDTSLTMLLIQALQNVGVESQWFSQSPPVPGLVQNSSSWVIMPSALTLQATDASTNQIVGYITYKTNYNGFITGPCSVCDTSRFNKNFFNPIIAALEGSYPKYTSFTVQAECSPWMVC